jgi:very-short-patch-repair endonuclease
MNKQRTPSSSPHGASGFVVVVRLWNNHVLRKLEGVLTSLLETLHERTAREVTP